MFSSARLGYAFLEVKFCVLIVRMDYARFLFFMFSRIELNFVVEYSRKARKTTSTIISQLQIQVNLGASELKELINCICLPSAQKKSYKTVDVSVSKPSKHHLFIHNSQIWNWEINFPMVWPRFISATKLQQLFISKSVLSGLEVSRTPYRSRIWGEPSQTQTERSDNCIWTNAKGPPYRECLLVADKLVPHFSTARRVGIGVVHSYKFFLQSFIPVPRFNGLSEIIGMQYSSNVDNPWKVPKLFSGLSRYYSSFVMLALP